MSKTALHFGAGNIGRGFITPILQENGYEVALVDVDSDLVNKLNTDQEYSVNFIGSSKESITVSNINALNLSDSSEIQSLISNCDFVSTSVGPQYVNSVLQLIANLDLLKSINFVAFENKYRASTTAKNESDIQKIAAAQICVHSVKYLKFIRHRKQTNAFAAIWSSQMQPD